ncbi:MAG: hypothetical protein ACHQ49_04515 [Elusimicrobiota bacterium]
MNLCVIALLAAPVLFASDETPRVRVIYLVPADRSAREDYSMAIGQATRDIQSWYARQLGGRTFRLSSPIVEVVNSTQTASWFAGHTNAKSEDEDRGDWAFNNAFEETARLVGGVQRGDGRFIWAIFADAPGELRGGLGVSTFSDNELRGLKKDRANWIGLVAHEMGHSFGLHHPLEMAKKWNAVMSYGCYGHLKAAYLTEDDKIDLRKSLFFIADNISPVRPTGRVPRR